MLREARFALQPSGGNQVDGLPPAPSTVEGMFATRFVPRTSGHLSIAMPMLITFSACFLNELIQNEIEDVNYICENMKFAKKLKFLANSSGSRQIQLYESFRRKPG